MLGRFDVTGQALQRFRASPMPGVSVARFVALFSQFDEFSLRQDGDRSTGTLSPSSAVSKCELRFF